MRTVVFIALVVLGLPLVASAMTLRSPAFGDGQPIPTRFTCDGVGKSPPLVWSDIPDDAKSLTLTITDPDAPSGVFTHWIVFDIPPTRTRLETGFAADSRSSGAVFGINSQHHARYFGMCPPHGQHRYRFRLVALDTRLPAHRFDRTRLKRALRGHVIARAGFTAHYTRQ